LISFGQDTSSDECDLLSTAQLGMVALDVGDAAVANSCASYIVNAVAAQVANNALIDSE
jgi:hypothetical protein